MSVAEQPPQQEQKRKRAPLWAFFLAIVIPFAVVAAVMWFLYVAKPVREEQEFSHTLTLQLSGLATPTVNKLDPKFTDANGDGVADPPTDANAFLDPPTLVFSYVPLPAEDEEPDRYEKAFQEFVDHVGKVTGKKVEYKLYTSLKDQLKAMRDGQLHFAGFNTGAVPEAVDLAGFVPLCKLATPDGSATLRMQIIVPADSPIQKVDDLKGHQLTMTEPGSNSGYKAALVLLSDTYHMDPARDYTLRFSGSHDNSILGIATKKYEAAAVASDVLKRAINHQEISPSQYRVIEQSVTFPTACFGCAYNIKPELAKKIGEAIYSFDWKGTGLEKEFASSEQTKFVPANYKDDWELIRRIDDKIGAAYKIE